MCYNVRVEVQCSAKSNKTERGEKGLTCIMAEKIRCSECGNIIAYENEPINDRGEISIMCNNRKPNGKRCKTINIITRRLSGESGKDYAGQQNLSND